MKPVEIRYSEVFATVREDGKWFLSERKSKKDWPIFDLEDGKWCSIQTSKDGKWLILFYKGKQIDNTPIYYKSFVKIEDLESVFLFTKFNEVFKDSKGWWVVKK